MKTSKKAIILLALFVKESHQSQHKKHLLIIVIHQDSLWVEAVERELKDQMLKNQINFEFYLFCLHIKN
jgi:hypothetical protein